MTLGQLTVSAVQVGADLVASYSAGVYGFVITRATIVGPNPSTAFAYKGNRTPAGQFDSTRVGWQDTSEYNSPVEILPGMTVWMVWPGVTDPTNGTFVTYTTDKLEAF